MWYTRTQVRNLLIDLISVSILVAYFLWLLLEVD